ncbi:MAG: four helix bundle protein [Patescibacteria group bacterium]|nr:four helix bundle protein [Patescibacteria group bacterium]
MEENKIVSYKDLIIWQKSIELVVEIYKITASFPKNETFGLVSQMRRNAVSIPSNIAEGRSRGTRKDFRQFLIIAYGSAAEMETQIIIVKKLAFGKEINFEHSEKLLNEIVRMLNRAIHTLKTQYLVPKT